MVVIERMLIYSHEIRLTLFGLSSVAGIYIMFNKVNENPLPLQPYITLLLIYPLIIGAVASLISLFYLQGYEPGKYFVIWYWSYYLSLSFLKVPLYMPYDFHPVNSVIYPLFYALVSSASTIIIRLIKRTTRVVSMVATAQLWGATVIYTIFFYFVKLIYPLLLKELIPFLIGSFLASFFGIGNTNKTVINLCAITLLLTSAYLSIRYISSEIDLEFLGLIFLLSLIYYYIAMKVIVVRRRRMIVYGAVVTSYPSMFFFPVILVLIWFVLSLFIHQIPQISVNYFPIVFLPATLGNMIMDYLKGRSLPGGVVGGVGMADGLWLDFVLLLIYYLFFIKYGLAEGSIYYIILGIGASFIVSI
ncbi:MAG: hypothetical protein OWQ54_05520 [Sulfolobaceae archaeon]|nr:hypothetical protein [Sulfolobaceae archaeon]